MLKELDEPEEIAHAVLRYRHTFNYWVLLSSGVRFFCNCFDFNTKPMDFSRGTIVVRRGPTEILLGFLLIWYIFGLSSGK